MSWFSFSSDYIYCKHCGAAIESDFVKLDKMCFCDEYCMENFIESNCIRYPYGVDFDEVMYPSFDNLLDEMNKLAKITSLNY